MRYLLTMLSLFLLSALLLMCALVVEPVIKMTPQAEATVAYRATVESLTEQAQLILYARVDRQWTPRTRGPQGQIYTYTQLTPLDVWVGEVKAPLLLVQLGGQIDDLHLKVHGDAELKVGQELVLFLTSVPDDRPPIEIQSPLSFERSLSQAQRDADSQESMQYIQSFQVVHLVSMAQGVFYLEPLAQGEPVLRQNLEGLVFYEPQPSTMIIKYGQPTEVGHHDQVSGHLIWKLSGLRQRVTSLKREAR